MSGRGLKPRVEEYPDYCAFCGALEVWMLGYDPRKYEIVLTIIKKDIEPLAL